MRGGAAAAPGGRGPSRAAGIPGHHSLPAQPLPQYPITKVNKGSATTTTPASPAKDPFSTPARRRRIIADVAKFLLRQYCVKACDNVIRFRQWTRASTVIQRAWRCHVARQRLHRLRFSRRNNAAIVLQCAVRCFVARQKLKRRRLAEWTRRATALALVLQAAVRWRRRERRKREERALHRARMLKRKNDAARNIQRVFRGMLGRRIATLKRQLRSEAFRKRHLAAIRIQSGWRRRRARHIVRMKRRRRRARWLAGAWASCWYRRWRRRRIAASIHAQRSVRGFLARRRVQRMREEKARREREEALRLAALAAAEEAATRRIEIRLSVKAAMLRRFSVLGPGEAVQWCLKHKILRFMSVAGFALGGVLVQVVGTVESAFPSLIVRRRGSARDLKEVKDGQNEEPVSAASTRPSTATNAEREGSNVVSVDAQNKCIKLRRWGDDQSQQQQEASGYGNKDEDDPIAALNHLPTEWQQVVKRGSGGAEVSVDRGARSIDLRVKIAADAFALQGENKIRWTVVTIVLEGEQDDQLATSLFDTTTDADQALPEEDADFKFKFRDTVVLLQKPSKPVPVELPPVAIEVPEATEGGVVIVMSPSSPMGDSIGTSEASPFSPSEQDHRITITIEEPPLDYEGAARKIQLACRIWLDMRWGARHVIRRCWRRRRRLKRWRKSVRRVLRRAHASATVMQSVVRRFLAGRRVAARRLQACSRLKSNFQRVTERLVGDLSDIKFATQSEQACWAAFGLGADVVAEHAQGSGLCGGRSQNVTLRALPSVKKRNDLLKGLMSVAKLPPAPPGTVMLFSHLVANSGQAQFASTKEAHGVTPPTVEPRRLGEEDGWGAVTAVPLPEPPVGYKASEKDSLPIEECGYPEIFLRLARRKDQTDPLFPRET